jgi:hypothetical protein
MTTYTNPYTGQTVNPSQVGYEQLTISTDTYLDWPINGNVSDVVANIIEVNATVSGLNLYMPPATQVSDGQSALIRNIGSNSFTVVKSDGATIISVASGIAEYVYVTNNTTLPGTWSAVTFGAGTSAANAADLAGYGLTASGITLNQSYFVSTVNSDYTLLPSDRATFQVWESGAGTLTLPSASAVGNNWFVMIRNNGTGILNVYPVGVDTIDGNSYAQLQLSESFVICSNGSSWNTFGYGQSAQFFFTQLSKVVTGGTVTLSSAEAANIIQEYSGTLTSNCIVVLPPTVQIYSLQNKTTGAFSLTFKTGAVGATSAVVPQGQTYLVICDGTNVYNTQATAGGGGSAAITLPNGSALSPSLNFLGDVLTGLYLQSSGQLAFSITGTNAATLTSTGLLVPVGISGGVFS